MAGRARISLILIAFIAFISLGLPDGVNGVAWPSVRRTFGLPVENLALLIVAGTCGYLVASFFSGVVVRRLGVGRVLLISSLLVVGASAGYAMTPAWTLMVGLGVFSGLGAGAIDAGLNAYAARHFSARLVNWLHAFYGMGAALGPALMTGVLASGHTWRLGYALNACLIGIMAVCFLLTLKRWQSPTDSAMPAAPHAPYPATLATLRRPVVMLSVALFFCYTGLEVTAGAWSYSLFTESRHVSPMLAGTWVSVYWASLTAGRIIFGAVAAHVRPLAIVRAAMIVAPVGAALIWSNASQAAGFVGLALIGFCFAPMFPTLISLTPGRVGKHAADQAVGFQVSAASLGAAGIPGLTGLLAKWIGLEVVGVVLVGGTLTLLVLHEILSIFAARQHPIFVDAVQTA
jgi:fucose permease